MVQQCGAVARADSTEAGKRSHANQPKGANRRHYLFFDAQSIGPIPRYASGSVDSLFSAAPFRSRAAPSPHLTIQGGQLRSTSASALTPSLRHASRQSRLREFVPGRLFSLSRAPFASWGTCP